MPVTDRKLHFRLAFALVLSKSKPSGVTIEEYILALRQSLLCRSRSDPGAASILDRATLWHTLFLQVQRSNLDLRARVAVQHDEDSTATITALSISHKRKLQASAPSSNVDTQSKRRKCDEITGLESEEQHTLTTEQHRDRASLLRVIYDLAHIKDRLPDNDERKDAIIRLACDTIIETCRNAHDATTAKSGHHTEPITLNEGCIATRRIWSILLARFRSNARSFETAGDHPSSVDSTICSVIASFLGLLHQYCLDEADHRAKFFQKSTKARKSKTKATLANNLQRVELFKHNCSTVASTLAYMLAVTATLQHTHPTLFEAIASVFLQYLGSVMSRYLFSGRDNDGRINLAPPRVVPDASHIETTVASLTIQLEAPYLISVLEGLMRGEVSGDNARKDFNNWNKSPTTKINPIVLHKLQGLLVRGIFDDSTEPNARNDTGDERLFTGDIAEPQARYDENESNKDWFLSQVWELIGWDILLGGADDIQMLYHVPAYI